MSCNTPHIVHYFLMNTIAILSTFISFVALYKILKIQFYSQNKMQNFLFNIYLIFYISSILILPFSIVNDSIFCATNLSAASINRTTHILFGFEMLFFISSSLMFNIVLFARLYFTFKDSVYNISKKCTILSIGTISLIILLYLPGFTLYAIVGVTLATVVLYAFVFLCLMIFSQILVIVFVYKLFAMNLESLVNNLSNSFTIGLSPKRHTQSEEGIDVIQKPKLNMIQKEKKIRSFSMPSIAAHSMNFSDYSDAVCRKRRLTIDKICAEQIQLMTKYSLLAMLSVVSSFVVFMVCLIWILSGFSVGRSLFGMKLLDIVGVVLALHSLLDVVCVTFAFKIFEKQYRFLCSCCDQKLKICCFNMVDEHYQSKSEAEKNDLHAQVSERNSSERGNS